MRRVQVEPGPQPVTKLAIVQAAFGPAQVVANVDDVGDGLLRRPANAPRGRAQLSHGLARQAGIVKSSGGGIGLLPRRY
jgi:hypothetical protein